MACAAKLYQVIQETPHRFLNAMKSEHCREYFGINHPLFTRTIYGKCIIFHCHWRAGELKAHRLRGKVLSCVAQTVEENFNLGYSSLLLGIIPHNKLLGTIEARLVSQ